MMNVTKSLVITTLLVGTIQSFGHSGGLDSNGGHMNHFTGEYHFHGGGGGISWAGTANCAGGFAMINSPGLPAIYQNYPITFMTKPPWGVSYVLPTGQPDPRIIKARREKNIAESAPRRAEWYKEREIRREEAAQIGVITPEKLAAFYGKSSINTQQILLTSE